MSLRWRPRLSPDYVAAARVYALDVVSALLLFVCASIMAGRVWRFAFEDELLTRAVAERSQSAFEFLVFFLKGGDIHPPLAFLAFYGLLGLGFADWGIRLFSLAMTGLALALFHTLCLTLISRRSGAVVRSATRLIAILLFGLCPMAVSQGDAIRWYPVFAALFALFVILYAAGGNKAATLWSAVALGLAASTNFLAILVALPFLLYRYALERQFRFAFEAAYWLIVAVFAGPGLWTFYSLVLHRFRSVADAEFDRGLITAIATDGLGLFGGAAVGVGMAWVLIPVAVVLPLAMISAVDRKRPADTMHLLLLMLGAVPVMAFAGFAEPRSFLYLAPVMATILTLFLSRQDTDRGTGRALLLAALVLAAPIGAIANLNQSMRPFKRSAVIPFQQIIDVIESNGTGSVMVLSTDPVLVWLLQHDHVRADRCVSYIKNNRLCFDPARRYDSVFVVSGHSNKSRHPAFRRSFEDTVRDLVVGKTKAVSVPAGLDLDAELKSWLTGVPLDKYILTVDLYR